ncbi:DUF4124 domain-containing protein [uncultured Pseudoalteromonas sp.]|uniref:DUF4124 domain-containing protein n=1 Tax=uncultured Pseudoalteromonas sp. TaxID=114053 RepID=UPI000C4F3ADE|nr:DUF4124 domain-containing protein [uncultured Pseudoalteromonas sp.]MBD56985.1 DUF4124 domain-containing protein [Pseudoalteromonas sp.]|tara:strand:+ start:8827 stop:9366 length:540 start_codon:yes stop_codon:yes gene_type:complete
MKRFCYFAVILLLTSVALLFYIKKPDGKPYLELGMFERYSEKVSGDVSDFASQSADTLTSQAKKLTEKLSLSNDASKPVVVYKWQDEQGQWHYADTPHPNYFSIAVSLDPNDITVLPAETFQADEKQAATVKADETPSTLGVYDPKNVQKMMQDAEQAKQLMEQRNKQLEQQLKKQGGN